MSGIQKPDAARFVSSRSRHAQKEVLLYTAQQTDDSKKETDIQWSAPCLIELPNTNSLEGI